MKSLAHALSVSVADSSVPDGELLARFAETGDAAAFELLVRRHADLVWRVCRGELPGDRHTAEDAFQATFLVLARKARAVREPSAAGFLFRVARNTAVRARKRVGQVVEAVAELPGEASANAVDAGECSAAVVAEVQRLPDKFRLPVLLCFFEDCTHTEAADRLGWAVGTVASRLARAKDRLRDQLTRKGFALPSVLVAATVTGADVRAAVTMATTPSAVPMGVSELTREVLNAMWNSKAKLIGGGVLALLLVGGFGLTVLAGGQKPDEPKAKAQPKAKGPEKTNDDELKKLQGMWRVLRIDTERGSAPAKELETMRWEITGNLILAQDSPDQKQMGQTRFTIDPSKSPKWMTMKLVSLPKGDVLKTMEGIYELKGNKLSICCVASGQARPTEFKVSKGTECGLIELVRIPDEPRVKPQPNAKGPDKVLVDELKKLQGVWRVTRLIGDAGEAPADIITPMRWEFVGNSLFGQDNQAEERKLQATFTIDPTKALKQITLIAVAGPKDQIGKKLEGIYESKGNTLRMCFAEPETPRPTEFKVVKKGEGGLIELERIPDTIKGLTDLAGEWRVLSVTKEGKEDRWEKPPVAEIYRDVLWLGSGEGVETMGIGLDTGKGFLDLIPITGPVGVQGMPHLGRFTWKDNQLTIIFAKPGKPRPAEANSGKNVTVMVLERGAKK